MEISLYFAEMYPKKFVWSFKIVKMNESYEVE